MVLITYFLALTLAWSAQVSGKTTGKTTTRTTRNFLEPYKLKDFIVKKTTVKGRMQIYYDLNKDSKVDQIETFELKTFESRQFESRRLTQKKIDRNFDGKFDYTKDVFFGRKDGLLDKSNSDTNFDGKIDKTEESYLLDRTKEMNTKKIIVYTKLDKNHDGKMNVSFSRLLDWRQHKEILCNDRSSRLIKNLTPILTKLSTTTNKHVSEDDKKDIKNNFYITEFGFKIHEDCIDKWGKSDILETVQDGLSTGMQCLVELEKKHQKTNSGNSISGALRNAVAIQSLLETQQVSLICNEQKFDWTGISAHASVGEGYDSEYDIEHPFISLSPACQGLKIEGVNETIFHEVFHNIGYRHGESIEYAHTCAACCFPNTRQSDETKELACDICAMDETEASSKQYVEKIVNWSSKNYGASPAAIKVAKTYIKENSNDRNKKRWGLLQLANTSSVFFNPIGVELTKIIKKNSEASLSSRLSLEETNIVKENLRYHKNPSFKPYQSQTRIIAEAMYAFYMEGDVDGALKKIEENLDEIKIKPGTYESVYSNNKSTLEELLSEIYLEDRKEQSGYTSNQKKALQILSQMRANERMSR